MFGRWLGNRGQAGGRGGALAGFQVPRTAGVLSCRVLDPVNEPVQQAEFVVTDSAGRRVTGGETDPFGSVLATVPAGDYRLAVTAEGFTPFHGAVTVTEGAHATLGDVTLQVAQPRSCPTPVTGTSSRTTRRSASPLGTSGWPASTAGSTPSPGRSGSPTAWRTPPCT